MTILAIVFSALIFSASLKPSYEPVRTDAPIFDEGTCVKPLNNFKVVLED